MFMLEALCLIAAQYLPKEGIIWAVSTVSVYVRYEYSFVAHVEEVMRKWRALDDMSVIMK